MGQAYKTAAGRIVLFNDLPINQRNFELVLIEPQRVKFDVDAADLETALDTEDVNKAERIALRTQVIPMPNQPVAVGLKILQFFANNPNHVALQTRRDVGGILIEKVDETDTPLFYLNPDEVWLLGHGEGFAVAVTQEALEPATS